MNPTSSTRPSPAQPPAPRPEVPPVPRREELLAPSSPDRLKLTPPPAAEADKVMREARAVWIGGKEKDQGFRHILRDPHDVNGTSVNQAKAKQLLAANAPLERAAIAKLDENQKAAYERLKTLTAQDAPARLALQVLLLSGKLPGDRPNTAGSDTLAALDALAQQPLANGLKRSELVSDLIQELALPSAINQKNKNTCAAASLQILWAMQEPAEYVRIVAGLASPAGTVTLASGTEVFRASGTERTDDSRRSASSRLWQAAMLELGNGPDSTYDNAKDQNSRGFDGLDPIQVNAVVDALNGRKNVRMPIYTNKAEAIIARIEAETAAGRPVPIGLKWGERDADGEIHGGHMVLATRVEAGRLYFNNPWGIEESMDLNEIKDRLQTAIPLAQP